MSGEREVRTFAAAEEIRRGDVAEPAYVEELRALTQRLSDDLAEKVAAAGLEWRHGHVTLLMGPTSADAFERNETTVRAEWTNRRALALTAEQAELLGLPAPVPAPELDARGPS